MAIINLKNMDAITYMQQEEDRWLLHVTNCQGVMGAGIAKQIKERVPAAYEAYIKTPLRLGYISEGGRVFNMNAQQDVGTYKRQLNYGALCDCLSNVWESTGVVEYIVPFGMGCGLAGGDWGIVKEILEYYLPNVTVCEL